MRTHETCSWHQIQILAWDPEQVPATQTLGFPSTKWEEGEAAPRVGARMRGCGHSSSTLTPAPGPRGLSGNSQERPALPLWSGAGCLHSAGEANAFPWQAGLCFYFQMTLSDILTMLERARTWQNHHFLPRIQGLMGREGGVPDPSIALSWVLSESWNRAHRGGLCSHCSPCSLCCSGPPSSLHPRSWREEVPHMDSISSSPHNGFRLGPVHRSVAGIRPCFPSCLPAGLTPRQLGKQ